MPIAVVISSLILIFFGYVPPFYEIHISSLVLEKIAEQGDTAFLIVTVRLVRFKNILPKFREQLTNIITNFKCG